MSVNCVYLNFLEAQGDGKGVEWLDFGRQILVQKGLLCKLDIHGTCGTNLRSLYGGAGH